MVLVARMSVFALWPVVFWKYVFGLVEYVVFFKNVFSYLKKSYLNVTMCKYEHKNEFSRKNLYTYAAVLIYTIKYTFMRKYLQYPWNNIYNKTNKKVTNIMLVFWKNVIDGSTLRIVHMLIVNKKYAYSLTNTVCKKGIVKRDLWWV